MFMPGISGIIPGVNSTAVGAPGGTDPYWNNVVLMMGYGGADGSTTFLDESPAAHGNAPTVIANAQVDTAQSKFGGSSLSLSGADRIGYGDSNDWDFGSGDFTIEAWIKTASLTGFRTIVSQWATSLQLGWLLDLTSTGNLRFAYSTTGANTVSVQGTWTPSTTPWYHIAVSRVGNTVYVFADGVQIATGSMTGITIYNPTSTLRIGAVASPADTNWFNGWIDELRITKGVGRYTLAFTPPTAAFPRA